MECKGDSVVSTPRKEQRHSQRRLVGETRRICRKSRGPYNAFPNDFRRTHTAAVLASEYAGETKETLIKKSMTATVAGRIMLRRGQGKAGFITLQDVSGQVQAYVRQDVVGQSTYDAFKRWDIGDIVGVTGTLMRTNTGELTVRASEIRLLTKSLRPLPEKHAGLTDTETRYRQRYLDLIMNQETRDTFLRRSKIIESIRSFLIERLFLEVETPMMQSIPGGAAAAPFITHYNALDIEMYLRVAPELNLKRLVVGGFERVFEINRNGADARFAAHDKIQNRMLLWHGTGGHWSMRRPSCGCLLYTSPSPRDLSTSRMPSSA